MIGRRPFLRNVFAAMAFASAPRLVRANGASSSVETIPFVHDAALNATVPKGTKLRIVARSGQAAVSGGSYLWHAAPDGGACFTAPGGGWIYVSNSEVPKQRGGAGALRFDASGAVVDSYPILQGTTDNCAGGKTLWGTWLSCEEPGDAGQVYECDPLGKKAALVRPGLGSFNHEAAAMDPASGMVYLTEDRPDGCLYRFAPTVAGDLSAGRLEVAVVKDMQLSWVAVPDFSGAKQPLRRQVPEAAQFNGGEGIVYGNGYIYFTTKGDDRVWSLELATQKLAVIYDAALTATPILKGVDNIEISPSGELLIAEDSGDMQIVALTPSYRAVALVTLHGQDKSEIAGPAFSPDGTRLYFSSQRGSSGKSAGGVTYELDLKGSGLFG